MSYIGIPVRLRPTDPETLEESAGFETAVFATVRRCPALLKCFKAFNKLDVKEDSARVRTILARRKLLDAETPEDIEAAEADAITTADAHEDANAKVADTVYEFLVTGFKAAGYTEEQADRYASMVPVERIRELKQAALVGSGRLDFTKALTAT